MKKLGFIKAIGAICLIACLSISNASAWTLVTKNFIGTGSDPGTVQAALVDALNNARANASFEGFAGCNLVSYTYWQPSGSWRVTAIMSCVRRDP